MGRCVHRLPVDFAVAVHCRVMGSAVIVRVPWGHRPALGHEKGPTWGGHGALKGWLCRLRRSVTPSSTGGKQSCRAYLPSCAGSPSSRLVEVGGILPCASDSADLHQGGCQWRRRRDELCARSAMTWGG